MTRNLILCLLLLFGCSRGGQPDSAHVDDKLPCKEYLVRHELKGDGGYTNEFLLLCVVDGDIQVMRGDLWSI